MKRFSKSIIAFLICSVILNLTGAVSFAEGILNEDFESYSTPLDITASNSTGWVFVNAKDPAFTGTIDNVSGNKLMQFRIDQGNGRAHQKVRRELSSSGVTGIIEYKFKVFVPSGVDNGSGGTYNSGSGLGSFQVNIDDTNGVEIMAMYYTPGANGVEIKTCGSKESDGSDLAVSYGHAPFDTWIETTVYLNTETQRYYFTVTDGMGYSKEVTEDNSILFRNIYKLANYTGIPKYATAYLFRTAKNTLIYSDDIYVNKYIPEVKALKIDEIKYTMVSGESEIEISAPETGFICTSVSLSNANTVNSDDVYLITAAVNKESGKIEKLASDKYTPGTESKVTLKAGVDYDKSLCDYKHYLWAQGKISLINTKPAKVKDITVTEKTASVLLSWKQPADDYNAIKEYIIFKDGAEIARTTEPVYSDDEIDDFDYHTYKIQSIDHCGLYSDESDEVTACRAEMSGVVLQGETQEEVDANANGLYFLVNNNRTGGDNYSAVDEREGIPCRRTSNRSDIGRSTTSLYFKTDKAIISSEDRNITIDITYFDEGTGPLNIQYNATVAAGEDPAEKNIAKQITVVNRGDTREWKTARVTLTDAYFREPVKLTNCDFRLNGGGANPEILVSEVKIIQTEKF